MGPLYQSTLWPTHKYYNSSYSSTGKKNDLGPNMDVEPKEPPENLAKKAFEEENQIVITDCCSSLKELVVPHAKEIDCSGCQVLTHIHLPNIVHIRHYNPGGAAPQ